MTPTRIGAIVMGILALFGLGYCSWQGNQPEPVATVQPDLAEPNVSEDLANVEDAIEETTEETVAESVEEPADTDVDPELSNSDSAADEDVAQESETNVAESIEEDAVDAENEVAELETDTDEPATETAPKPKSEVSFDVVRVEPGGSSLIAGRSAPGATLKLWMDGEQVAETVADAEGGFVMFAEVGASETPRVLSMTETWLDGTELEGATTLMLSPVAVAPAAEVLASNTEAETTAEEDAEEVQPSDETEVVDEVSDENAAPDESETAKDEVVENVVAAAEDNNLETVTEEIVVSEAEEASVEVGAVEETVVDEPADVGEEIENVDVTENAADEVDIAPAVASTDPVAPTVIIADSDGVRVVQSGGATPASSNVSIDAISYDAEGEVALSGRATGESTVRVYLDNAPLLDAEIGADGQWRAQLPDVDTGTYTLRVDELGDDGAVVSRTETPFKREPVEQIQALDEEKDVKAVALLTVQPGNTLWGIARENYGEGRMYVRVFEANADRIRNPDLIYPGQIFTVPADEGE